MFNLDKKYLQEDMSSGGTAVNKDGCYEVEITKFKIMESTQTMSEWASINFLTEEGKKAWISIFYKDSNGNDLKFNLKTLTHLTYLLGLGNVTTDNENNVPAYIGTKMGVILKVSTKENQQDGKLGYDYKLLNIYDLQTKQTAYEKANGKGAETYSKFLKSFENAPEITLEQSNNNNQSSNNDNFGFGNDAFPLNDSDIPF